jgi:AcrR family transcriptional regulator
MMGPKWYGTVPDQKQVKPVTPTPPRQHRTAKGAARVDSLTDAAVDMFLDQGYEAVSLDTLIARIGGSRRNIYRHFGGKEGLFLAAIASACEAQAAPLKSLHVPLTGSPAAALSLFGKALLERVLLPRTLALFRLMIAESSRFPELAQTIWRSGHEQAVHVLAEWITHQQQEGTLRTGQPPHLLARQFIDLAVADAQLCAQIGIPAPINRDAALNAAIDTFLRGQATDAGPTETQGVAK